MPFVLTLFQRSQGFGLIYTDTLIFGLSYFRFQRHTAVYNKSETQQCVSEIENTKVRNTTAVCQRVPAKYVIFSDFRIVVLVFVFFVVFVIVVFVCLLLLFFFCPTGTTGLLVHTYPHTHTHIYTHI